MFHMREDRRIELMIKVATLIDLQKVLDRIEEIEGLHILVGAILDGIVME